VLLELLVENYAVVETLSLRFRPGFNVLTGETGSGKSIVVGALGLLLGGRASTSVLRTGTQRARVSGVFDAPPEAALLLAEAGIELDGDDLIVDREILAGGKSRAWIANRPVSVSLLRDLAPFLGDIHGQHEQQRLFSAEAQLTILDDFAGLKERRASVGNLFRDWRECDAQLKELDRADQERLRLLDLWKFQRNEIEGAALKNAEDVDLESERRVLQNIGRISESATAAYEVLYDSPESAYAHVRQALKRLDDLHRFDDTMSRIAELLKPAEIAIDEAAGELRDYLGRLEADPARLEEVEARLAAIDKLKRKYGASVSEILTFLQDVTARMDAAEHASEHRAGIERRRSELAAEYESAARALSAERLEAASKLAASVQSEIRSLAMDKAVFTVELKDAPWSANGLDQVGFLVSANAGEEPRAIDKVASGGELSRIALALKTCVTGIDRRRTLVFDEVDAGIGGAVADSIGLRLKELAARDQVLCVTHLAQIAGYADCHYAVEKRESHGRTGTVVVELNGEARTREIGRMLSGRLTPEALRHAEQLLRSGATT
jgi:DNA repair protein RecN (Recombination protein N)